MTWYKHLSRTALGPDSPYNVNIEDDGDVLLSDDFYLACRVKVLDLTHKTCWERIPKPLPMMSTVNPTKGFLHSLTVSVKQPPAVIHVIVINFFGLTLKGPLAILTRSLKPRCCRNNQPVSHSQQGSSYPLRPKRF